MNIIFIVNTFKKKKRDKLKKKIACKTFLTAQVQFFSTQKFGKGLY